MEKSGTQFAVDFKPVFSASTIVTFLGKPGIKTKVDFLKKFEPFSEFKPTAQNKNPNPILLSRDVKDSISQHLNEKFSNDCLEFDDTSLVEKYSDNLDWLTAKLEQIHLKSEGRTKEAGSNEDNKTEDELIKKIKMAQINR